MENNFYRRLQAIPLFQGISRDDFMGIAAKVHFDFCSYDAGDVIVMTDEPCQDLVCIIQGTVTKEMWADDGRYLFREVSHRPTVIQPDRLFGLHPRYNATYVASDDTQVLRVPKHEVRDILFTYVTFHLNFLNFVCSSSQTNGEKLWRRFPQTLEERFVHFVTQRSTRPAGHKELHMGMVDLAEELVTTRLNVSHMLNGLRDEGLIQLSRGHIVVPELEKLIQHKHHAQ